MEEKKNDTLEKLENDLERIRVQKDEQEKTVNQKIEVVNQENGEREPEPVMSESGKVGYSQNLKTGRKDLTMTVGIILFALSVVLLVIKLIL